MKVLVTGGAGFIGTHLCARLLKDGHTVQCADNLLTGTERNIEPFSGKPGFSFLRQDVCEPSGPAQISYDLTRLQHLATADAFLVTLNPAATIRPAAVRAAMTYEHPLYTPASVAAQRRLPELNDGRLAFAGAYQGWGFHEDGCRSGAAAALSLGGSW